MAISTPRRTGEYPDRNLDCQIALEDIFAHVLKTAARCGWNETETALALIELANARLSRDKHNELTQAQIQSMSATKH